MILPIEMEFTQSLIINTKERKGSLPEKKENWFQNKKVSQASNN